MTCKEEALKNIAINSLSVRQAAKWFLLHEKERHFEDIFAINNDLEKLTDVKLPLEAEILINERFEISPGVTAEEKEGLKG